MVLILLFLYFVVVVVGITQEKIPYQTEIKYSRFDLVVNE